MSVFRLTSSIALVCAFLTATGASPAPKPLPLEHGVYIQKAFACKGAPNAAVRVWDGVGLSGAHSSHCTSRIVSRTATTFTMSTTCAALGDGSPQPSGVAEEFTLSSVSKTAFVMSRRHERGIAYRRCSAGALD
jgi:hypothetical protein